MEISTTRNAGLDSAQVLSIAQVRRRRESIAVAIMTTVVIATLGLHFSMKGLRSGIPFPTWAVMFVALFGQIGFSVLNARCPACNTYMGTRIASANFCAHCGVELKR